MSRVDLGLALDADLPQDRHQRLTKAAERLLRLPNLYHAEAVLALAGDMDEEALDRRTARRERDSSNGATFRSMAIESPDLYWTTAREVCTQKQLRMLELRERYGFSLRANRARDRRLALHGARESRRCASADRQGAARACKAD